MHFESDADRYADHILGFEGFDVIVVDGMFENGVRLKCTQRAIKVLRPGGMIILDNADWLPRSARALRKSGLMR